MFRSLESLSLAFSTKPTCATNGSITWIFCRGLNDKQLERHPLEEAPKPGKC
jgi:hypothetical protein